MPTTSENRMGTMPCGRLLLSVGFPIVISMSIQSLYTMVDSMFVSRLGESELAATTLGLPMITILAAIANGIAVGTNTVLSQALGRRDSGTADAAVRSSIFLSFVCYLIAIVAAFTVVDPYMRAQTNDAAIRALGSTYLRLCIGLSIGVFGQTVFERYLISTGKTALSMITHATGAAINLVLDPILIFGYLGFPALGIAGAAIATVIGQCVAFALAVLLNIRRNREIRIRIGRPCARTCGQILSIGVPASAMQVMTAIMFILFNIILESFSTTAVAVFGVCRSITTFFYTLANAMCSAVVPVLAYNYGAKNRARVQATMRYGFLYVTIIMATGTALYMIFPEFLLDLFSANAQMKAIGVTGVRLFTCSFLFAGVRLMSSTMMQALGRGVNSMVISLVREFVILIPVAYVASRIDCLPLVWASAPCADVITSALSVVWLLAVCRKTVQLLPDR